MSKKVRRGMHARILWPIFRAGIPEDFSNAESLTLHISRVNTALKTYVPDTHISISGNVVSFIVTAEMLKPLTSGEYRATIAYRKVSATSPTLWEPYIFDQPCFTLVDSSVDLGGATSGMEIETIELNGEIGIAKEGLPGASAYRIAVANGFEGDEVEWLLSLKQPALDAAEIATQAASSANSAAGKAIDATSDLDTIKQALADSEAIREQKEQTRQRNELSRGTTFTEKIQASEQATSAATQAANEANTAAGKAIDATSDLDAIKQALADSEDIREQKEQTRQQNELSRGTTFTEKIQASEQATSAATQAAGAQNTYNVTVAIPLSAGSYYTKTTARAAVPAVSRKLGLVITYATADKIWYTEKYIGSTVAGWATEENWEYVPTAAKINSVESDLANMYPAVPYARRVSADGGQIASKEITDEMYSKMLDLLPYTKVLFCPQTGMKTRTSGINLYASKLYDMSSNNNDAVQASESDQPFVAGNIALNEKRKLKGLTGETGTKQETLLTPFSFLTTDSWTMIASIGINALRNFVVLYFGPNSRISYNSSGVYFSGSTAQTLFYVPYSALKLCANNIFVYTYRNGVGDLYINGTKIAISTTPDSFDFTSLRMNQTLFNFDGTISYIQFCNKAISSSEIKNVTEYLRSTYPDIEGVDIGNQHWATSNYDGIVTGNGTVIPEVQSASTAVAPELVVNGRFDIDTDWSKDAGWSISDGKLNANSTLNASRTFQNVKLEKYKMYILSFDCTVISGEFHSQFGGYNEGRLNVSSSGTYTKIAAILNPNANGYLYFIANSPGFTGSIDNVSVKEVGWADLTTPAWSYYNNDPLNGAIYGKLYNMYAVTEIAKNPPKGWRVPTIADFRQLANYLGGAPVAGGKLKKDGTSYWYAPNSGADNSSGFSMLGAGRRGSISGGFADYRLFAILGTLDKSPSGAWGFVAQYDTMAINPSDYAVPTSDKNGFSLRLIRVSPVGDQVQNLTTGVFTTNIASGVSDKLLSIPFGYRVTDITIKSANALTNVVCTMYNYANTTLQGTLLTGKSVAAGAEVNFATNYDAAIQYQNPVLRFNATGNGGDGMEILVTIKKVLV